jgi:DNA (cytosine-5)-methyltransferase 1
MILRGDTGAGKTTFLNTVGLFRRAVVTERIAGGEDIPTALRAVLPTANPRILVLEGREALGEVSAASLEAAIHAINIFVRSEAGRETLVAWPTNTDALTAALAEIASAVGGEALVGVDEPARQFTGPPRTDYVRIAERTVERLNDGASLADLGISEEQATKLANKASTIGLYLALIRRTLIKNGEIVRRLLPAEQFRLWIVVIAGNDPEPDVAALTRGGEAHADIARLMTSTGANVVKELKRYPEQVGILGTVLDAKILHLDIVTALALARSFGDAQLHALMRAEGLSTQANPRALARLEASDLGLILSHQSLGTRRRGPPPRSPTRMAFQRLASIASRNDSACNRALGVGLVRSRLGIQEFGVEVELGTQLTYKSDLLIVQDDQAIRIEVMWRSTASRAQIANYALGKFGNYGRAIGLLT